MTAHDVTIQLRAGACESFSPQRTQRSVSIGADLRVCPDAVGHRGPPLVYAIFASEMPCFLGRPSADT
jgi:hypothetical protein